MTISNIRFFNFNNTDIANSTEAAPFGTCSHCFHNAATDSGARQVKTEKLQFFNCSVIIKFQTPYTAIFHDLDGSLTGLGPGSWATGDMNNPKTGARHLEVPEC